MCDLTDYNRCPNCESIVRHVNGKDVCSNCDWSAAVIDIPRHLADAEPGTVLESSKSGESYEKLVDGEWMCLRTAQGFSDVELYAEEGDNLS